MWIIPKNSPFHPEKHLRDNFLLVVAHIMVKPLEHITVPTKDSHDVR